MNIIKDWDKIKKECPISLKLFIDYLIKIKKLEGEICFIECLILELLNKNDNFICYCNLEKFFDDHGILIIIDIDNYVNLQNKNKKCWYFKINGFQKTSFNSRQEAKEKAIYKAFEIMEGILK